MDRGSAGLNWGTLDGPLNASYRLCSRVRIDQFISGRRVKSEASMLRFGQSIRLAAAALIAIASGVNASAATIESKNLDDGTTIVFLRGDIALGDEKAFANVALAHDNAIVVLQSAGGNLHAGIEIGKAIRLKGYSTY